MLITRCPHCETAFRIQAAHLEQAEGHVRCGRCANVFDAYQELRQSLSPTLTDLAENSAEAAGAESATTQDESEFSSAEVDQLERDLHADPDSAETEAESDAREVDIPPTVTDEEIIGEDETERKETPTADKERLEFNLPADQWQDFFSDTVVGEDEVPAISDTGVEWVVLGETDMGGDADTGTTEAKTEAADEPNEPDTEQASDADPESEAAADDADAEVQEAESDVANDAIDPDMQPDGHVMDLTAVEAQTSAVAEPDPESALVEGLFRDLEEEPLVETRSKPNHWYSGAALLLVVMLCGQYVHYNRQALATQASIGPWLMSGYSRLGIEISPDWNLDQYQINRWVAASDSSDADNPSLKITAQITNRGPKAQPYPLVQLALKDRWDETVAGRVFEPAEYLRQGAADGLLAPGQHIQAELKVLDPGQDAYGFELDVCMRTENQLLQCANEPRR